VLDALRGATLSSRAEVARTYGQLLVHVYEESKKNSGAEPDEARRQLLEMVASPRARRSFQEPNAALYVAR